jgi:Ca2+-binding RTX toxin-like protein
MSSYIRSGSEFIVNTTQPRSQAQSDGTLLSNGNFVLSWIDADFNTTSGRFVRAQIYQADGIPSGVELTLASSNGAINPAIAGLANGGFVATWSSLLGLQAQIFDASGAAVGAAITVTTNFSATSDIVGLANGGFALTWNDTRATGGDVSGSGVRVSTYDQNGIAVVSQALVNTSTIGNQADPSITSLSGGGYVVTWTDRGAPGTGVWQIKAQIYDASGLMSGSELVVNPTGSGSVESSVTTLSNGNFAVAWSGGPSGGGPADSIQVISAQGVAIGAAIVVPKGEPGLQTGPVLTALSNGGFVMGWVGNNGAQSDGSGKGIFIQIFDANAQAVGGVQSVNDQLHGDQILPSIVALANGGFVVNWTDLNAYGADDDSVHAQIFMPDTNAPATDVTITSGGGGAIATIAALENDSAVAFVRATPAATSSSLTYSISGGADAGSFTIDANTGLIKFITTPDFEAPSDQNADNTYDIVVTASDGTSIDSQTISIVVANGNDAPVINSAYSFAAPENGTVAATVTAVDPEGNPVGFSIISDVAGPEAAYYDASKFSINSATGVITFNTAPNFEAPADYGSDGVYNLLVRATDSSGAASTTQAITITVGNVNEGTIISSNGGGATAAFTIDENLPIATTVVARDNIGPSLIYSISGGVDAAKFAIDAATGALTFLSAPNYESPSDWGLNRVYDVIVSATDGLLADTQTLAITIRDVNEAPIMWSNGGGDTAAISVNENTIGVITTVFANDPEHNTLTYSIVGGADAARFTLNSTSGSLSFVSPANFEAPTDVGTNNVYDVIVQASDGSLVDTQAIAVTVTNVNDAPLFTSSTALSTQENATAVATLVATDDDNQTITYSINGGVDAARFTINAATGALSFVTAPNYEAPSDFGANNVYNITVGASDGSLTTTQSLAVTVTNQYEGTVITSNGGGATAAFSVNENQLLATTVVVDNIVTFSISGGADAALFAINVTTGVLSFLTAPNYEAPNDAGANRVYDVTVAATDGVITDTQALAITVNNVNEAPIINSNGGGDTAAVSISENTALAATVQATDPENTTRTYSIIGGADANRFSINSSSGSLSFVSPPNFESPLDVGGNNVYDVVVKASDGTLFDTQAIAVTVMNVNDAPVFTTGTNFTVQENSTAITTVAATDEENQAITYSVAPIPGTDYSNIFVDPTTGALRFLIPPNFEAPTDGGADNINIVIVEARDGTTSTFQTITITVTNVNEAPVITSNGGGDTALVSINENTTAAILVTSTDPENTARTYSIVGGADAAMFSINATTGLLSLLTAKNFEAPTDAGANNIYDVIVSASDGVQSDTQAIAFRILNVNEAVTMTSATSFSVAENQTAVATITATDLDGTSPTYSITGGVDAARFTINATTGVLKFVTAPNFEAPTDVGANNVYNINVRASDGSLSDTRALTITVTDQNEAVVITSSGGGDTAALSVAENASAVTTVTSVDPENTPRIYTISGGADSDLFTINANTGVLAFVNAPNFEAPTDAGANNVYNVVVSASDGVNTDTQALAVTVTNVNEGLSFVTGSSFNVVENTIVVATVSAVDLDGDAVTYSISGGADAALFTVNSATGALVFANAQNFEAPGDVGADNVYNVVLTASDGVNTDTKALAVTVINTNEGLSFTSSTSFSIVENTTAVATVSAVDLDGDTVSYSISGGADAAKFVINAATGALSFINAPDFETPGDAGSNNTYDVLISGTDGSLTTSSAISVTVGNANEAPVITSGGSVTLSENTLVAATISASDVDFDTLTYSISGGDDAQLFSINTATGELQFVTAPNFEVPADANGNNVYDVSVTVSDGGLSNTQSVHINVTDVNEAVIITSNGGAAAANVFVVENSASVTTVTAADPENSAISYTIVGGNDAAVFAINTTTGALSFIATPNFEIPFDTNGDNVYNVIVSASDGVTNDTQALAIVINNVNEAPVVAALLADQSFAEDTAFSFVLPAGSFADVDGSALSYTASLASGAVLPSWISFNASTQAFGGTSPLNYNGAIDVKITASDGSFEVSDIFTLTTTPVNDSPVALNDGPLSLTYNVASAITAASLLANDSDVDGPALTITSVFSPSRGTVVLQGDGSILFTPEADYIGPASFSYSIIDGAGGYTSATVLINVNGVAGQTINGTTSSEILTGTINDDTINGLAGSDTINGNGGVDTLFGGTGNDTYVVDSVGDRTIENLSEGTDLVQSSISWSLGSNIENLTLTGTANSSGTGNSLVNVIVGNIGNNTLNGAGGLDNLAGGFGNDTYIVDQTGVVTSEAASAGTDTLQSSVSWTLAANIENLVLTGLAAINGTGNTLANTIVGNSADNILSGSSGADTMTAGLGNDTYVVDNAGDITAENANEGTDSVQSTVTWTLAANIENLVLTGTATINGTGNSLNNTLSGNTGTNILDGGAGADALSGGSGNDTYIVDNVGDVAFELAAGGTDLVQSSISWTLANELENLTLTGTSAIDATGNSAVNVITGNASNNILNGGGGLDTLIGGLGDDTFVVDTAGIVTTEAANAGTDTVASSVTWMLSAYVENLVLTGSATTNGTGNTLANLITGNSADNILNGGIGADTLMGGFGNDTYVIDNAADITSEAANGGVDLVQSSVTWTLAGNVENLTLAGTSAINGTGNALDNILIGNTAANKLIGGDGLDNLFGGAGNDTLTGGVGNDSFVFATGFGKDIVTDFSAGLGAGDLIQFSLGTAFDSYAELVAVTTQVGANCVITISATDTVTLNNVLKSTLAVDDFMFM